VPTHPRRAPMSRTVQITFDAADPRSLSRFWAAALGYVHPAPPGREIPPGVDPFAVWEEFLADMGVPAAERLGSSAVEDPEGNGPRIFFQRVPEAKTAKNRMHLDLRAAPGLAGDDRMGALEAECTRLVPLGATRVQRFEP